MIDELFKGGNSFAIFPFRVFYHFEHSVEPVIQAGVSVPAKKFKKAVDRNRIKRLMREAYRLNKIELTHFATEKNYKVVLFIIYTGREIATHEIVFSKIKLCLSRLITTFHESNTSPA